jgi:cytochrome c oxidase subunit 1
VIVFYRIGPTGTREKEINVFWLLATGTILVWAGILFRFMGAIAFAVFAAVYYWFPLYTGQWYQRALAKWHFWLSMIGTNVTFFPMIVLGYGGMPRRYAGYDLSVGPVSYFADLHAIATVGVYLLALGQLRFVYDVVVSWLEGPRVESGDPWDLEKDGMRTHEWAWFERKLASGPGELAVTDGGSESDYGVLESDVGGSDDDHSSPTVTTVALRVTTPSKTRKRYTRVSGRFPR